MDALAATDLVAFHDNPAHKRSPLVELTDKGRDLFQDMRRREAAILREIVRDIPDKDLTVTMRTLAAVIERLSVLAPSARD